MLSEIQSIWTGRSGMGCKVYSNGVVPSGKTSVWTTYFGSEVGTEIPFAEWRKSVEERVFGEIRENKDAYLEENSLQRGLKQYLLAGKKVGIGRGIIINER